MTNQTTNPENGTLSPVIAGMRTREGIKNITGYNDKVLRQYFNIDWTYAIDKNDALREYGNKNRAFSGWKRGFKGFWSV